MGGIWVHGGGGQAGRKQRARERIINKLRQAEVEIPNGATVAQVCKKTG